MSERTPTDEAIAVAEDIVAVLRRCGFSDEEIVNGAVEAPDAATTPVDAVAHQCEVLYGGGNGVNPTASVKTRVLQNVIGQSVRGITIDVPYHHKKNVEFQVDDGLHEFGYGFEFRTVGAEDWIEPDDEHHPRAFQLTVLDDTGETVSTAAFRYPPYDGIGHATTNFRALGVALNETVLDEIGVTILLLDIGDDVFHWVLFDSEALEPLESEYGPRLEIFGEPLVNRGPTFKYGWDGIDSSVATDHESVFGVSEPQDTFKLEEAFDVETSTQETEDSLDSEDSTDSETTAPSRSDASILDRIRRLFA